MTYSERLRNLRSLRGFKQDDLARVTGIPVGHISTMETGKVLPIGDWDTAIRAALNWTPEVDAQLDALTQASA